MSYDEEENLDEPGFGMDDDELLDPLEGEGNVDFGLDEEDPDKDS